MTTWGTMGIGRDRELCGGIRVRDEKYVFIDFNIKNPLVFLSTNNM